MISRRFLFVIALVTTAACFFLLGTFHARTGDAVERAEYDAKLDAIRAEVRHLGRVRSPEVLTAGTSGDIAAPPVRQRRSRPSSIQPCRGFSDPDSGRRRWSANRTGIPAPAEVNRVAAARTAAAGIPVPNTAHSRSGNPERDRAEPM